MPSTTMRVRKQLTLKTEKQRIIEYNALLVELKCEYDKRQGEVK